MDNRAFFGAVLKAIACTRNRNTDQEEYTAVVPTAADRIRRFEEETGGRALTPAEVDQVLSWLDTTFEAKRVPAEERAHYRAAAEALAAPALAAATPVGASA